MFKIEYNEFIEGFVVTAPNGAEANLQYCPHARAMRFGVEGGHRSDDWSDEIEDAAMLAAENHPLVQEVQELNREIQRAGRIGTLADLRAEQGFLSISDMEDVANMEE